MGFDFDPSCLHLLLVQVYSPAIILWVTSKQTFTVSP